MPIKLSVLDLSPIPAGSTSAEALANTLDLARLADELGYTRYWMSEHHNTALLASAAPELMIAYVASATKRIRVGSGGVMLPNHAPLKVAEAFRLLEAFHPGRIDLGLGRAPGTDPLTAFALRRSREKMGADDFPEQLSELIAFLTDAFPEGHPFRPIQAIPLGVSPPPIWLLGSSDFSARLAGELGLGFAFAHHINPAPAIDSLRQYRQYYRPSELQDGPLALLAVSAICAPTDEEAETLAASADLALLRFRQNVRQPLPSVQEALAYEYADYEREAMRANRERFFVGSPATLHRKLSELAEATGVSELMITTLIHDHGARRRSYELLAEVFGILEARP